MRDTGGKMSAFGFGEYETPEHTLRAMRVLSGLTINGVTFKVNAEDRIRSYLDSYLKYIGKTAGPIDDATRAEDQQAIDAMFTILRTTSANIELSCTPSSFMLPPPPSDAAAVSSSQSKGIVSLSNITRPRRKRQKRSRLLHPSART